MNDLIERSMAVEAIYWEVMEMSNMEMAESVLSDVPTVDAEPVRHGRWFTTESHFYCGEVLYSACRTEYDYDFLIMVGEKENQMCGQQPLPNYCPHCGAKMDAEEETEVWNCSNGRQIIAPKGTFDKLYYSEDEDEDV